MKLRIGRGLSALFLFLGLGCGALFDSGTLLPEKRDRIAEGQLGEAHWEVSAYRKGTDLICLVIATSVRGVPDFEGSHCEDGIAGYPSAPMNPCYLTWVVNNVGEEFIAAGVAAKQVAEVLVLQRKGPERRPRLIVDARYPANFFVLEPADDSPIFVAFDTRGRFIHNTPHLPWAETRLRKLRTDTGTSALPVGKTC